MRLIHALSGLMLFAAAGQAVADDLRFVALGDMPYGKAETTYQAYESLISKINAVSPDLVIHVGDTQSGKTPCTDTRLDEQLAYLDSFKSPTLYTPGDNEWTDCHRKNAGRKNPLKRLERIRATYFDTPGTSFGNAKYALEHQGDAGFPENARIMSRSVMFVTAHVVGSNNGFEPRSRAQVAEFFKRDDANIAWINAGFDAAAANGADALVLAIHADIFKQDFNEEGKRNWRRHSGFRDFGKALRKRAEDFGKPVLLVFGDGHKHKVFKPFPKKAPNMTAVEVFGAKEMHAVEIAVRRNNEGNVRFDIAPLLNPAL